MPITHAARVQRAQIVGHEGGTAWWAPREAYWWIAVLFTIGSTCFLVGPFPGFIQLVGSGIDGIVFFLGSIFFTFAALLQYLETANAHRPGRMRLLTLEPRNPDWWATCPSLQARFFSTSAPITPYKRD